MHCKAYLIVAHKMLLGLSIYAYVIRLSNYFLPSDSKVLWWVQDISTGKSVKHMVKHMHPHKTHIEMVKKNKS